MPRLDKMGPQGQGPRTGRGLGNCQGNGVGWGLEKGNKILTNKVFNKEEQKKILEEKKRDIEQEIIDLEA